MVLILAEPLHNSVFLALVDVYSSKRCVIGMAIHIEISKRGKRFVDPEQGANLSLSNVIARVSFNQEISTRIFPSTSHRIKERQ